MRSATPWFATLCLAVTVPAAAYATTVAVAPPTVTLAPGAARQFTASIDGTASTAVTWMVNGIPGGAPSLGTINISGLYTAPADVPASFQPEIEAQSTATPMAYGAVEATITPSTSAGPVYYVATTGSDGDPGTSAKPWRTIQHAANTLPAGGTGYVRSGVYNEYVTVSRSGSADAGFITLAAAPGAAPIVDGTGLGIPHGENGLFTLTNVSYVRIIGFEIRNYTSSSAALDPVGVYITGAGSNIEILSNHIHNIATTVKSSAGDALGIAVYGTAAPQALRNVIIDGNRLNLLTTGFSESLAISGNVQNWQVTNNLIHNNDNIGIDLAGYEGVSPQTAYDRARSGYVAGNTVSAITSLNNPAYGGQQSADGIYVDGATQIVIERNLVYHTDIGIEVASEHQTGGQVDYGSQITVRSNVVYGSNVVGMSIGGYANDVGGTRNCSFANNTLVGDDTTNSGSGEIQIQYHATGNSFRNNIAVATNQGLLLNNFTTTPNPPAVLDHDLYDSPLGTSASQWIWLNKTYTGFAKYVAGTPNDHHGMFNDPGFVDSATHNYQLAPGSVARGAGALLPLSQAGLFDFAGNPRTVAGSIDLGAYQN